MSDTMNATPVAVDPQEIESGKMFAILSYVLSFVGLPFFIIPLIQKDNSFSLYHAKQVLMLWIAGAIIGVASAILTVICIGPVLGAVAGVALFVFAIMGLMAAAKGEMKPLPLIGKMAEEWFKTITKKA